MDLNADENIVIVPAASQAVNQKETAVSDSGTWMVYLKSAGAGLLAVLAIGASLIGIFGIIAKLLGGDVRPGAALSWKTGVTAALIFALGFAWQFSRAAKVARATTNSKASGSASTRRG